MSDFVLKAIAGIIVGVPVIIVIGPFALIVLKIFYHMWCAAVILLLGGDLF